VAKLKNFLRLDKNVVFPPVIIAIDSNNDTWIILKSSGHNFIHGKVLLSHWILGEELKLKLFVTIEKKRGARKEETREIELVFKSKKEGKK